MTDLFQNCPKAMRSVLSIKGSGEHVEKSPQLMENILHQYVSDGCCFFQWFFQLERLDGRMSSTPCGYSNMMVGKWFQHGSMEGSNKSCASRILPRVGVQIISHCWAAIKLRMQHLCIRPTTQHPRSRGAKLKRSFAQELYRPNRLRSLAPRNFQNSMRLDFQRVNSCCFTSAGWSWGGFSPQSTSWRWYIRIIHMHVYATLIAGILGGCANCWYRSHMPILGPGMRVSKAHYLDLQAASSSVPREIRGLPSASESTGTRSCLKLFAAAFLACWTTMIQSSQRRIQVFSSPTPVETEVTLHQRLTLLENIMDK